MDFDLCEWIIRQNEYAAEIIRNHIKNRELS